jgi:hypothetical protein
MSNLSKLLIAALAILLIAGCEGEEDVLPGLVNVRLLHASPDAPRVNVTVKGLIGQGSQTLTYKEGTPLIPVRFGETIVEIETIRPGGNQLEIELKDFAVTEDVTYDVVIVGKVGDSTIDALVIENPQTDLSAGNIRLQFVHAATDMADVLIYVTTPDASLDSSPSLGPIAFMGSVPRFESPAGLYQIRVALASDPLTAIYDSGALNYAATADLMITFVDNIAAGDSPVSAVVLDGTTAGELLDVNTTADLRFVHAAPDAPAIDVIVDDAATPSVAGLAFTGVTDYLDPALTPGTHNFKVIDSPAPGTVVTIDADPELQAGVQHTVFVTGLLANLPLAGVFLADDNRGVATEARFRIIHASNTAGTVDVYVATPGQAIGAGNLALINLRFQSTAGYLSLLPGDYEITLTEADEPTAVIVDAIPITVAGGGVHTAVAVDTVGGIAPVEWIMIDDSSP